MMVYNIGIQHYLYTIKWIIRFICLILRAELLLFFPQLVNLLELIIQPGKLTKKNENAVGSE